MIFRDDEDRESFLHRLGGILLESATPCWSWSLLGNHGHFHSGHCVLLGKKKREWQDRNHVLRYFGTTERHAKHSYLSFVAEGAEEGRKPELVGGGLLRSVGGWKRLKELRGSGEKVRADERILGGSEFVERILKEAEEDWERKSLLRQRGIDLQQLVERICAHFGLEIEDLKSESKVSAIAKARAVLCYVGARQLGLPSVSIARELGVSPSAVSRAILRGKKLLGPKDIDAILSESL